MAPTRAPMEEVIDLREPSRHPSLDLSARRAAIDPDAFLDQIWDLLNDDAGLADCERSTEAAVRTWGKLLRVVEQVRRPSRYVGSFRKAMASTVTVAQELPAEDRRPAGRFLVEVVSAFAASEQDYRHGIVLAMQLDPSLRRPRSAVEGVLRPALRARTARETLVTPYALKVVFELLAQPGGPHLVPRDFWPIRAAIAQVRPDERPSVVEKVSMLHKVDRGQIDELLSPAGRRRKSSWLSIPHVGARSGSVRR